MLVVRTGFPCESRSRRIGSVIARRFLHGLRGMPPDAGPGAKFFALLAKAFRPVCFGTPDCFDRCGPRAPGCFVLSAARVRKARFSFLEKKNYFCRLKLSNTMATTADIKNGMCIELNGKTFSVVEFLHVKPGKGPAFVRTKLKNLENGRILDKTFSAGERIEPVRVERRPYQYLYEDDLGCNFMHTETFEQIHIDRNLIENSDLMREGQIVEVMFHTEKETVGRAASDHRHGGDLYRTRRQGRYRLDELAEARDGRYRRDDPRAAVHPDRRKDSR